jgi:hypothetical protein
MQYTRNHPFHSSPTASHSIYYSITLSIALLQTGPTAAVTSVVIPSNPVQKRKKRKLASWLELACCRAHSPHSADVLTPNGRTLLGEAVVFLGMEKTGLVRILAYFLFTVHIDRAVKPS